MNELSPMHKKILAVVSGVAGVVLVFCFVVFWMPNTSANPAGTVVTVPRGSSFKSVMDSLEAAGAIRSRWTFSLAGRLLGTTKSIKVGKYLFASGHSNGAILRDLAEGESRIIVGVTIPEGWRMGSIARAFARDLGVDSARLMAMFLDSAYVRDQGFVAPNLEGYLLPDTYHFQWQTDEREIVDRMVRSFKEFYVDSLAERAKALGLSQHQALALASIVEGESSIDEERPIIAGVYWNRLRIRMRLEADPTVQYVIPGGPRRLLYQDLKFRSPYNTYLYYGLPPGPINNPGRASILATLYPERHDYLFFVATGVGGHRFSKTYREHQQAVNVFRRHRRAMRLQTAQGN